MLLQDMVFAIGGRIQRWKLTNCPTDLGTAPWLVLTGGFDF